MALTTTEGLSSWWTECRKGDNGNWVFTFPNDYVKEFEIVQEGNQQVKWKCVSATEEWMDTEVQFDIEERGEELYIHFRHKGWEHQSELFGICNFHWALYLKQLKSYVENGVAVAAI